MEKEKRKVLDSGSYVITNASMFSLGHVANHNSSCHLLAHSSQRI